MKSSDTIENIAQALCKMQTEIDDAPKDSQAYGYKYADLGTVLHLMRPVMASHGLAVMQLPCNDGDRVGISTRIMHTSGEWFEDTVTMQVDVSNNMSRAQAAGSVLTYCRRYSLAAVAGIAQVDDDNQVSRAKPAKDTPQVSMPTKTQYALLMDYMKNNKIPARRNAWLTKGDTDAAGSNWQTMTASQAATIIKECQDGE